MHVRAHTHTHTNKKKKNKKTKTQSADLLLQCCSSWFHIAKAIAKSVFDLDFIFFIMTEFDAKHGCICKLIPNGPFLGWGHDCVMGSHL